MIVYVPVPVEERLPGKGKYHVLCGDHPDHASYIPEYNKWISFAKGEIHPDCWLQKVEIHTDPGFHEILMSMK